MALTLTIFRVDRNYFKEVSFTPFIDFMQMGLMEIVVELSTFVLSFYVCFINFLLYEAQILPSTPCGKNLF